MSNKYLSIVRTMGDTVKGPSRAVLVVLADRADDSGTAWPSWKTLQRESGFSRSAVHAALQSLKKSGFVTWTQRRDESGDLTSNVYRLSLPGPGDGLGSPGDGLGSPPDGLGVVRETDGGSPGDGRRSIIEASSQSPNEASLFGDHDFQKCDKPATKKKSQELLAESIYEEYPRKVAKKDALKAILKALKSHPAEYLLERTKTYAAAVAGSEMGFIPFPATWFNKERFADDPSEWNRPSPTQKTTAARIVNTTNRPPEIEEL